MAPVAVAVVALFIHKTHWMKGIFGSWGCSRYYYGGNLMQLLVLQVHYKGCITIYINHQIQRLLRYCPPNWFHFTYNAQNLGLLLQWRVTNELNVKEEYILEKSTLMAGYSILQVLFQHKIQGFSKTYAIQIIPSLTRWFLPAESGRPGMADFTILK